MANDPSSLAASASVVPLDRVLPMMCGTAPGECTSSRGLLSRPWTAPLEKAQKPLPQSAHHPASWAMVLPPPHPEHNPCRLAAALIENQVVGLPPSTEYDRIVEPPT